jgi:hypothetical protein
LRRRSQAHAAAHEAVRDDFRNGHVSARAAADIYRQPQNEG